MGRRVQKKVYTYVAGSWSLTNDTLLVYDGWNLIQELDNTGVVQKSYVWGMDLSQTFQDAGGIGGLIVSIDAGTSKAYYFQYDANGNVGQLVDGADGSIGAHYECDVFGNLNYSTGLYADENPFRFSTKYFDNESNLYYYGHRYYAPELGRWLNRDPIEEDGGINLYGFVLNNPIYFIDYLGREAQIPSTFFGGTSSKRYDSPHGSITNPGTLEERVGSAVYTRMVYFVDPSRSGRQDQGAENLMLLLEAISFYLWSAAAKAEIKAIQCICPPEYFKSLKNGISGSKFDPEKLKKIQQSLEKQGVDFITGEKGAKLANKLGGEAMYIPDAGRPGVMVFGNNPTRTQVIEELMHFGQHKNAKWCALSREQIIELEIEAQKKLLQLGRRLGWTSKETKQIENALKKWAREKN